ncbi:MAG TPA: nitroreductase family deazaflavin-dependent oxidoreductase, partial [Streptosporangiaceae bacterium]
MSSGDRLGNAIFGVLARAGIGPAHLLTTRGRKTGRPRTVPVILVQQDGQRWLVAPYGAVSWVLNARAAGRVTLRRGRDRQDYTIRELAPAESGPILKRYIRVATATRPYFQAAKDSPVKEFIAEAHRHPVFELTPPAGTSADNTAPPLAARSVRWSCPRTGMTSPPAVPYKSGVPLWEARVIGGASAAADG